MFKIFLHLIGTLALILIFIPKNIFAAELIFKESPNDNKVIEVYVDPQLKNLNVVEGVIEFSGTASDGLSVQIENGQSVLSLWPTPPLYDENKKSINFTGGVPNGFDSEGLLFQLHLFPKVSGSLDITYVNGSAYLNDGKGTQEVISSDSIKIYIDKDGSSKTSEVSSEFGKNKYVIIILLLIGILLVVFKYVFKKIQK